MDLTIIGCGDAFGTGGRLQSAYLLDIGQRKVLLDCGATTQIGFNRIRFNANEIDTVLISHLHGDHYAGLVWMLLSALYVTKRKVPLRVVGPPTIEARFTAMVDRYSARAESKRPVGARPVHIALTAFPRPEDPALRRKAAVRRRESDGWVLKKGFQPRCSTRSVLEGAHRVALSLQAHL